MKTVPGFDPASRRPWLPGALALLLLTACATTPSGEQGSGRSDGVDVGYGTVDKDRAGGSVASVDGADVKAPRFRTLMEMLSRVPGLQVTERAGGEIHVRVRGSTSFQSNEEPLFVLDGMAIQFSAGISGIDPNTIESITVLKDAGDTAIYGSRGANGVILIRTKRAPR